jgi:WD40 repeat protein
VIKNTITNEKCTNFNPNNLKLKKSIILTSPIFSVRYSHFFPNILAACDESGFISLINSNTPTNHNNTQTEPTHRIQVQDNTIFDFDWCSSDTRIITASGSAKCLIFSVEKLLPECTFSGHFKSVKSVKQAFYNDNLFASCGRDGLILLWDIRERKKNEELMVN